MKIGLTSDLHVEHHPEVVPLVCARVRELAVDVLVVAGDLTARLDVLEQALAALARAAPRVLFVPGNHDLWCSPSVEEGGPDSRARFEREIPARCARAGVHPLGAGGPLVVDGVTFVGATGWYDYSLRSRELDGTFTLADYRRGAWGRLRWNDKARVVWPSTDGAMLDDEAICSAQVALLEQQLDEAGARPTVVVTHHLPFAELVTSKGEPPWDFINGFMGSARLGEAMQRGRGVRLGCCGHTHFRKQARVRGVAGEFTVEASPIGYPREYARYAGLTLPERVLDRVIAVELPP
jgi:Icc-related predicted phosphoesterase